MAAWLDQRDPDRGRYVWMPVFLAGLSAALILGAATFHLRRHGVGTLDNDAYSYIAEWQWIRSRGLFGAPRPPTGNLPKPLLVVLYGLLYEAGHEAVAINLLCLLTAAVAAGLIFAIGRRLHSPLAGLLAVGLLLAQESFFGAATTANSTVFMLALTLGALYVQLVLPAGAARAYSSLGLLAIAGLCRPEGWILYLLLWPVCYVRDVPARFYAASPGLLFTALLLPAVAPLLDRAFFGDWLYSFRSLAYFQQRFLGAHAVQPWSLHLVKTYLYALWDILGSVLLPAMLAALCALGAVVLGWKPETRRGLALLLTGCGVIVGFHVTTFRTGFFPTRFVLVPLAGLALLGAVGAATPITGLIERMSDGRPPWSPVLWLLAGGVALGACWLYGPVAIRGVRHELLLQDTLDRFLAEAATACHSVPRRPHAGRPARVLVDNAFYNPLRFHAPADTVFDRLIEELRPGSPDAQIARYDALCLGLESTGTARLIAAAMRQPKSWRPIVVRSEVVKPLYLFARTGEGRQEAPGTRMQGQNLRNPLAPLRKRDEP